MSNPLPQATILSRRRPSAELKDAGQVNNPDQTEATRIWLQHTLSAVAPRGTVSVQVRISLVNGEYNIDLPHQTAWVDDFSLTAVPEPSTDALAATGGIGLLFVRRRRKLAPQKMAA